LGVRGADCAESVDAKVSNAMKPKQLLFCLGVLALSATPALAKPAYVTATVNLRAAPGTTSEIVGKIPGGSLIDAKDCSENWCAVTWRDKSGFAIQTSLDMSGRVPRQAAARPPAYRRNAGPAYGPDVRYLAEDEPVYYAAPPAYYYRPYYRSYYRPYWGWRRHWW
jgi:uncharacterized protein YraI